MTVLLLSNILSCMSLPFLYSFLVIDQFLPCSITNPDKTILPDRMAIIAQQNNFDCSKLISQDQANQPAAKGYTIQLADTLNSSHVSISVFVFRQTAAYSVLFF